MTGFDLARLGRAMAENGPVVRILVRNVSGSAPREAGTSMLVWRDGQTGTIGGGALEWQASVAARRLLDRDGAWGREALSFPLGPGLGQCCGGAVQLLLERIGPEEYTALDLLAQGAASFTRPIDAGVAPTLLPRPGWVQEAFATAGARLFLYGAGHVGRALVSATAGLPLSLLWIDDAAQRFPREIPEHAEKLVAANPADATRLASPVDMHLVMTYSHAMDLEICHRVLSGRFAWAGLIGSASKAARFRGRLRRLGHDERQIARLECPVGDRSLGKSPAAIALGIATGLCRRLQAERPMREGAA